MLKETDSGTVKISECRNSAYFVTILIAQPLFWTGKPV